LKQNLNGKVIFCLDYLLLQMINYPVKDHISYYFAEQNPALKEKFYHSVLFQIFNQYFDIVLNKYKVYRSIEYYDDLKQELQIHAFKNLSKIMKATDSNSFLIVTSKNYIVNYIKCRMTVSTLVTLGESYENIS
jgi:hypothetical protein